MFIYRNRQGVNSEKILSDAREFGHNIGGVSPQAEAMFRQAQREGLADDFLHAGRAAVGMAISAMLEIDSKLRLDECNRRQQLGQLMNPKVAVLASTMPERIFRPEDSNMQWLAMMEIVSGVGVPGDLSSYEQAGLVSASSPLLGLAPYGVEAVTKMVRRHVLSQVGGFVKIYEDDSPKNIVGDLEADSRESGIGYEANLVTESARTEAEAERNLNWYIGAIEAGAKRIAIKPTSLVPFSDSALAKPVMRKKLADALKKIFEMADKFSTDGDGNWSILSVDSERSDIVDMVRDAFIEASKEFPKVKVQIAMQSYLHDTEKVLLDPVLEASKKRRRDQGGEPLGARLVNGANEEGEKWLSSAMGWHGTPLVSNRAGAHANYMRLRSRMMDPLKDGDFTLTIGTMNMITLMNSLQELARAGVFASRNGGFVHFAMLKGMTGQEVFRYLKQRYNITAHEYVPVIPMEAIVELFK